MLHGDAVAIHSRVLPREGVKLPWHSRFLGPDGGLAAEACVDLVLVDLSGGASQRRLQRRLPPDLEQALAILRAGPAATDIQP